MPCTLAPAATFAAIRCTSGCVRSLRLGLNTIYFYGHDLAQAFIGVNAMNKEMTGQAEAVEEILTFDVPDDALERAASAEQKAFTLLYCTNPWYDCSVPQ
jgi:hypothetical protein